ncbi:MAG: serine acetyltransferase, partial [Ferruginibacter sp.]
DNVIIYSGATILGGGTVVAENSIIGGNVWLTYSVPAYSVVYRNSEIKVRDNNPLPEGLNFVI